MRFFRKIAKGTTKAKVQVRAPILWSKLQADPVLMERIKEGLKKDLIAAGGISENDIADAELKEDTTQTITTASNNRMHILATGSGTKLDVNIPQAMIQILPSLRQTLKQLPTMENCLL